MTPIGSILDLNVPNGVIVDKISAVSSSTSICSKPHTQSNKEWNSVDTGATQNGGCLNAGAGIINDWACMYLPQNMCTYICGKYRMCNCNCDGYDNHGDRLSFLLWHKLRRDTSLLPVNLNGWVGQLYKPTLYMLVG